MNNRIQDLLTQATPGVTQGILFMYPEQMERFVQLIVRECVTVMYNNAILRQVPPDIDKTPTHYALAILEHFGVTDDSK